MRDELKAADRLQRKQWVAPSNRTESRDKVADWVEETVVEPGRWADVSLNDLAAESGWSRQHIANTIEHYFDPDGAPTAEPDDLAELPIDEAPESVVELVREVYREGFRDGFEMASERE